MQCQHSIYDHSRNHWQELELCSPDLGQEKQCEIEQQSFKIQKQQCEIEQEHCNIQEELWKIKELQCEIEQQCPKIEEQLQESKLKVWNMPNYLPRS